ncbi:MAG: polyprenyl synthetase family protein [Propionibacteriaceae bacterium]
MTLVNAPSSSLISPRPTLTRTNGSLDATLREVDALLDQVVTDLGALWATGEGSYGDQQPVDVLGAEDLPQQLQRLLVAGGKRIRPAMCHWGWVSAGGADAAGGPASPGPAPSSPTEPSTVVQVAAALELLHVFALIHDDVMDESESRRGQPTVHVRASQLHQLACAHGDDRRFGESMAILVGDLAHSEADHLVSGLPAPLRHIWRFLVIELVAGQRRDITGSAAGRRDMPHARQVARMKSGAYTVERPLQLGATAAGAEGAVLDALQTYGRHVGEAFALRDDILGVWGDPGLTGKPAGDDLVAGKPTVIVALADQRLKGADRVLLDLIGSPDLTQGHVAVLQHSIAESGVLDAVESMITAELDAALAVLDDRLLDPAGVAGLTDLAHQIAWRNR